ncbi:unnamed protein product, partial [Owenia fusiformis]
VFWHNHIWTSLQKKYIEDLRTESLADAIALEIGTGERLFDGITIMTDARHGWRKNAKDCDVVCIGNETHKMLNSVHVTKLETPLLKDMKLLVPKSYIRNSSKKKEFT